MLLRVVEAFRRQSVYDVVEAAHMELADPDIAEAFTKCVNQGAERIVVFPYFLSPCSREIALTSFPGCTISFPG